MLFGTGKVFTTFSMSKSHKILSKRPNETTQALWPKYIGRFFVCLFSDGIISIRLFA